MSHPLDMDLLNGSGSSASMESSLWLRKSVTMGMQQWAHQCYWRAWFLKFGYSRLKGWQTQCLMSSWNQNLQEERYALKKQSVENTDCNATPCHQEVSVAVCILTTRCQCCKVCVAIYHSRHTWKPVVLSVPLYCTHTHKKTWVIYQMILLVNSGTCYRLAKVVVQNPNAWLLPATPARLTQWVNCKC